MLLDGCILNIQTPLREHSIDVDVVVNSPSRWLPIEKKQLRPWSLVIIHSRAETTRCIPDWRNRNTTQGTLASLSHKPHRGPVPSVRLSAASPPPPARRNPSRRLEVAGPPPASIKSSRASRVACLSVRLLTNRLTNYYCSTTARLRHHHHCCYYSSTIPYHIPQPMIPRP